MSNILIIDPDHGEFMQTMLEHEGHTIYLSQAIDSPHSLNNINLVILDAGYLGFRLDEYTAANSKSIGRIIPTLVMSVIPALAVAAARAGATAFLEKPFDIDQFITTVKQLSCVTL